MKINKVGKLLILAISLLLLLLLGACADVKPTKEDMLLAKTATWEERSYADDLFAARTVSINADGIYGWADTYIAVLAKVVRMREVRKNVQEN